MFTKNWTRDYTLIQWSGVDTIKWEAFWLVEDISSMKKRVKELEEFCFTLWNVIMASKANKSIYSVPMY